MIRMHPSCSPTSYAVTAIRSSVTRQIHERCGDILKVGGAARGDPVTLLLSPGRWAARQSP